MRHELRHSDRDVSKGIPSETFLSEKSTDAAITMLTGEGVKNGQKPRHKSVLTAINLLKLTLRLSRLNVEYTFSGGYAKNPVL